MPPPRLKSGQKVNVRFTMSAAERIAADMTALIALSLLAAPLGAAAVAPAYETVSTETSVSARAFVRILPGARIIMDEQAQATEHKFIDATITVEDGSQREAKLVEFQ